MTPIVPISNSHYLGVDLGTTNSCVSICVNGAIKVLDVEGIDKKTIPSVVRFPDRKLDAAVVGSAAKRYIIIKPNEVFSSIKSLMQSDGWSQNEDIKNKFTFEDKTITPTDIATHILQALRDHAQNSEYGKDGNFDKIVLCVPANSTAIYKKQIVEAALAAGFGVRNPQTNELETEANGTPVGIIILPEPTAAALAYGFKSGYFEIEKSKEANILVYDFGGGTFDVTILHIVSERGVQPKFSVLNTRGIAKLGGDDIDYALMKIVAEQFYQETGTDLLDPRKDNKGNRPKFIYEAQAVLKELAENNKIEFSNPSVEQVLFEHLNLIEDKDAEVPCNLDCTITREQFMQAITPIIDKSLDCVEESLKEANLSIDDIDRIVLVGGSSKGCWVKDAISKRFKEAYVADNVDTIVSQGAAIFGGYATGDFPPPIGDPNQSEVGVPSVIKPTPSDSIINNVTTHHIGIEVNGGYFSPMIEKGLKFDEDHKEYSYMARFTNPDDSGQVFIIGWSTQKDVDIKVDTNGKKTSSVSVHKEENGEKYFNYIGEFVLSFEKAAAHSLNIEVTLTVFNDNRIAISAKLENGTPVTADWNY